MPMSHRTLPGRLELWSRRILGCDPLFAGALAAAQLWLGLLWFFYWGYGIERGIILGALLTGLMVLRFRPHARSTEEPAGAARLPRAMRYLLIAALLLDIGMMAVSSARSLHSSIIPQDAGQTSWRAARLLWRGENPYGFGALTDLNAYRARVGQRKAAGVTTKLADANIVPELARYDATLDPKIRHELLPASANLKGVAAREMRLSGYKYGPVIVLITALVAPLGIPAAVIFLNGLACFALYAVNWRILRRIAGPELALAGAAMLALLLDRHITRSFINQSTTDVWPLLFGSLAVVAYLSRRPLAMATAIAVAVGCKSLPGLCFAPLLLRFRSPYPILLFAGVVGAIYLPWLLWDSQGILYNVFLWPVLMAKSNNSWQYFVPPMVALIAQGAGLCAVSVLWLRYLMDKETRLFWTLATSSTIVLLASGYLANNYIPWASLWAVAAIVEAFADRRARAEPLSAAPDIGHAPAGLEFGLES